MCSGNSLYTYAGNRNSLKEQRNMQSRVGYQKPKVKSIPAPQYRQHQVSQQQMGQRQRQQQQDFDKLQPLEIEVIEPKQQAQQEAPKNPSFNVYVDCIKDRLAEDLPLPALETETEDLVKDMKDRNMECHDGLFGNVIVHNNGLVLYTDINGQKFCEEFDT